MTLVKICGLKEPETLAAAIDAGADYVGFVFFPPSPRALSPEKAGELSANIPPRVKKVALMVNPENAEIEAMLKYFMPDILQLHGKEKPERVLEIKQKFGLKIMKAIAVAEKDDLKTAQSYFDVADLILFDAKPPKDAKLPGGNALSFDWNILTNSTIPKHIKWFLAGGINYDNLRDAIHIATPYGVDVSSGVEKTLGNKDIKLIEKFIKIAKSC